MKMPWNDLEGPAKVLITSVAVLLVAAGLCGTQFLIMSGIRGNAPALTSVFMLTGIIELVAMLIAAVVAVAALIAWLAIALYERFSGSSPPADDVQKLFDDPDKHDGSR
jgi:hypothetical protein